MSMVSMGFELGMVNGGSLFWIGQLFGNALGDTLGHQLRCDVDRRHNDISALGIQRCSDFGHGLEARLAI